MLNAKKLRARMIDAGYNRESLAKALNMSLSTLSSRMQGYSYFNTKEIEAICEALQLRDPKDKLNIFFAPNVTLS